MIFTGTYQRSLDGKARILLPKRLRAEIGKLDTLYLTPGTDHCLELHTQTSLHDLALRANQSSAGSQNIKSFARLFYAQAEPCDIDAQGRIRIPKSLADLAGLDKEIMIVGVGFNWELWNCEQWQSYLQSNADEFDRLAQTTFDHVGDSIKPVFPVGSENPSTTGANAAFPEQKTNKISAK